MLIYFKALLESLKMFLVPAIELLLLTIRSHFLKILCLILIVP
jgi:hypothetical protein